MPLPLEIFYLIFIGALSGICSSAPVGPVDLWIVNSLLPPQKSHQNRIAFISGIIVIDLIYAFISFWGYFVYLQNTPFESLMTIASSGGLIILGFFELFVLINAKPQIRNFESSKNLVQDFGMGVLLCAANPVFVLFWIFVAATINQYGVDDWKNFKAFFAFLGIILGDILWYWFLIKIAKRGISYLSQKFIFILRFSIAVSFVIFGIIVLFKYLTT